MSDTAEHTSRLSPGSMIRGYRLLREVGRGGMARVFEAVNESICKRLALKILDPDSSPQMARRFVNEARSINQIHHSGLINIFEFGETEDGLLFIAMELLDGQSLESFLQEESGSTLRLLSIAQQIASTLIAVHAAGVVHRDLTPSNVLLIQDAAVLGGLRTKLLDFGIAKTVQRGLQQESRSSTQAGLFLGTPHFTAPEQIRDASQVTDRADVYALGVVLFRMFAGQLPFDGDVLDVLARQLMEPAPRLGALAPDAPSELLPLVDAMLAKDPLDRPAMVDIEPALSRALAALSQGELRIDAAVSASGAPPSPAAAPSESRSTEPRSWRSLRGRAAAGGMVLIAALIPAWLYLQGRSAPRSLSAAATAPVAPPALSRAPAAASSAALAATRPGTVPRPPARPASPAAIAPTAPSRRPAALQPLRTSRAASASAAPGRARSRAAPRARIEAVRPLERSAADMTNDDIELLK